MEVDGPVQIGQFQGRGQMPMRVRLWLSGRVEEELFRYLQRPAAATG